MEVYIAEKPEVGKHIADVLNKNSVSKVGYIDCGNERYVTWCLGHLLELSGPEDFDDKFKTWSLDDLPMKWPVRFKTGKNKSKQLHIVRSLLKKATTIVSCTDIDNAGQMIGDELFEFLNIPTERVLRALINDNNPRKIALALDKSKLRKNSEFRGMYLEEKSRAIADQILGFNMTRLMTLKSREQGYKTGKVVSVGRVQSAIVGLVIARETERKLHISSNFYNVDGQFHTDHGVLKARFAPGEHAMFELDDLGRLKNATQASTLANTSNGMPSKLKTLDTKKVADSPPLPYDLLSLQVDCARYYGLSPVEVLAITQKLREKPYYAIGYNRSDCRYIDEENHADAQEIIDSLATINEISGICSLANPSVKSRAFNSKKVGAHGAICPTSGESWPLMPDELKAVFLLITRNYLLQFLPKRRRHTANYLIEVQCDGTTYDFVGRTQQVIDPGWAIVFRNDIDSEEMSLDEVGETDISKLFEYMPILTSFISSKEMTTTAKPSYTMVSLLNDLKSTAKYIKNGKLKKWMLEKDKDKVGENGGIGTAATRSDILEGLFTKEFLRYQGKTIVPTGKAELLYGWLPESIRTPDTTAIWSHYLGQIRNNQLTPEEFTAEVDRFIETEVLRVKRDGLAIPDHLLAHKQSIQSQKEPSNHAEILSLEATCPACHTERSAILKNGKFGRYWQCNNCKEKFDDFAGRIFYKHCPDCSKRLRVMKVKQKSFIGCKGYPNCKYTEQI